MDQHRTTFSTCACLWLAGLLASCAGLDDPTSASATFRDDGELSATGDDATVALTTEGLIRGVATATTRGFRGIPYAAAPVGALRWKPPQRHARWAGVLDASRFANHCPQLAGPLGVTSTTEDCLFLNVYAPGPHRVDDASSPGLRPVMVWIHGGGLTSGESDDYDATRLVEQGDVIVVTINYRLGALGFAAHPALTAESPDHASGNYGLMDQQEALRWVRRNILGFGGDPFRVTIVGESAGGLSVHAHLASPSSQGLFQRAIVQSGAYQLTQPALATAETAGTAFATRAGCSDQTAACLRGLSVAQVLTSQGGASLVIDHKVLVQSIGAAFTSGQFHRVPVIEGSTHDEWRLFVAATELTAGPLTAAAYPAAIQATLGVPAASVPLFTAEYPLDSFPSPSLALSALGTDAVFSCNARFVQQQLSQFVPIFAYELNDPNAPQRILPPVTFSYGSSHATDNQYIFTLPVTVPAPALDADQQRLSDAMISYWTSFARTGQPSSFAAPPWPAFRSAGDTTQSLVPPRPRSQAGFAADHHCTFWDARRS